jgi:hypothetical protein
VFTRFVFPYERGGFRSSRLEGASPDGSFGFSPGRRRRRPRRRPDRAGVGASSEREKEVVVVVVAARKLWMVWSVVKRRKNERGQKERGVKKEGKKGA